MWQEAAILYPIFKGKQEAAACEGGEKGQIADPSKFPLSSGCERTERGGGRRERNWVERGGGGTFPSFINVSSGRRSSSYLAPKGAFASSNTLLQYVLRGKTFSIMGPPSFHPLLPFFPTLDFSREKEKKSAAFSSPSFHFLLFPLESVTFSSQCHKRLYGGGGGCKP